MILFVSHDAERAGAQMVLLHLLRWLRGHSDLPMRVLMRRGGPLFESFQAVLPTAIAGSSAATGLRARLFSQPVYPWADGPPISLVYSNTVTNGSLVERIAPPGIPVITHVHELGYWFRRTGAAKVGLVKRQTSRFVAASRPVRDMLVRDEGVAASRVDVVPDFIAAAAGGPAGDPPAVRRAWGVPEAAFVVGGSGQESWRKGRDLFVQIAIHVHRRAPDIPVHFVWVGTHGDDEDQYRLAHDARAGGVADRVHWIGGVGDPQRHFEAMDAFAMVSREDPFPLVALEAAALGKPVLCFDDAGGIPDLVEDDAGFILPYLDTAEMANRVITLARDRGLASRLGARGRAKVIDRYTVDSVGPRILEIIEREMAGRG